MIIQNLSKVILLIAPGKFFPIVGVYEPDIEATDSKAARPAKRETLKCFDRNVKVGDMVVVSSGTRWGVTTMRVEKIDGVDVDFDSKEEMRWVIQRVDMETFTGVQEFETAAINRVRDADRQNTQRALAKALEDAIGGPITDLPKLPPALIDNEVIDG